MTSPSIFRLGLVLSRRSFLQLDHLAAPSLAVCGWRRGGHSGPVDSEPSGEPWIPVYQPRDSEHVEIKRSRLVYQSRKRGMLENGLVLSTFASRHLSSLTPEQLTMYDALINHPSNDWDIYYWITGAVETPEEYDNEVMDMLKVFVTNKDRESRFHQPSLYPE